MSPPDRLVVQSLRTVARVCDEHLGRHGEMVGRYARVLSLAAGLSESEADVVQIGGAMHDVGKICLPDSILNKPARLSADEMRLMRQHPEVGASIIGVHRRGPLATARLIALHHHERWDGSGYPDRLRGDEIPLPARIVAIADVFDALTTERPYKPAWSIDEAYSQIRANGGRQFDPALIEPFMSIRSEIEALLCEKSGPRITEAAVA